MEKLKKVWKFLANPPVYFWVLSVILLAVFVGFSFTIIATNFLPEWVAIIFYVLSAIFLTYIVYLIVINFKTAKTKIKEKLESYKTTNRLMHDYEYRTLFFARLSFFINTGFAIFTAILGILEKSIWYGALASYYIILSLLRYIITRNGNKLTRLDVKHNENLVHKKSKIYLACGISMLVLTFAMIVPVVLMVINLKQTNYIFDWFIFAIAAYTFYKVVLAIYNLIKAKKSKDRLIQSLKNINLADAGVSLLSLQVSLIAIFGGSETATAMAALNIITGAVVLGVVAVLGIIMIVGGSRDFKTQKENTHEREEI